MARFDSLTPIHKAVRALVYAEGAALQTADFADRQAAEKAAADLGPALHLMHDHHATEEQYFFPELLPYEPELVGEMLVQHEMVVHLLDATQEARAAIGAADGDERAQAGADLNRRFNELVAFYLQHLAQEEALVLPAMWRCFDDGRLAEIQGRVIAAQEPDMLFQWLGWMFKGLNRAELVGLLSGMRRGMPADALEAITSLGAASMDAVRWEAVRRSAGL